MQAEIFERSTTHAPLATSHRRQTHEHAKDVSRRAAPHGPTPILFAGRKRMGHPASAGSAFLNEHWPSANSPAALAAAGAEPARKTVPLPTIFTPGAPTLVRAGVMPKPSPANLRRFAEMPIARKAINTIKDRIAGMQWRIQPRHGRALDDAARRDGAHRHAGSQLRAAKSAGLLPLHDRAGAGRRAGRGFRGNRA